LPNPLYLKCRVAESNHGHEDFQSNLCVSHVVSKTTINQSIRSLVSKTTVLPRLVLIGRNRHQFNRDGQSNGQRYVRKKEELINPSPHISPRKFFFGIMGNAPFFTTAHHCLKILKRRKLVYYILGRSFPLSGCTMEHTFFQGNLSKRFRGVN